MRDRQEHFFRVIDRSCTGAADPMVLDGLCAGGRPN